MKVMSKYGFSSMSNSFRYIRITSVMSKWVNTGWPPIWLPMRFPRLQLKPTDNHHICSIADEVMKLVENTGKYNDILRFRKDFIYM